jgi:glycosyltransferase involved in cell wall biosynthesis
MEVLPYFLPDPAPGGDTGSRDPVHDRPYFLFVGRLERIKGLDEVIPLFARYRDADLLVAGDGEHGPALRDLARPAKGVRFLGRVNQDRLQDYYRQALALVVPSVCFETFGNILVEAFRNSTPVVARRLGPFPEITEQARGGLLFATIADLETALRTLQADDALRVRLGRAGHDAYRQRWTEDAVIPRYLDLVRRVAERRGAGEVARLLSDKPTT